MRFAMPWWVWNLIGAQGVFLLRRGGTSGDPSRRPDPLLHVKTLNPVGRAG